MGAARESDPLQQLPESERREQSLQTESLSDLLQEQQHLNQSHESVVKHFELKGFLLAFSGSLLDFLTFLSP